MQTVNPGRMRIATYNIRKAVGLDWRRDPQRIVAVLQEMNADIVILQEADRRIGTRAGVLPLTQLQHQLGYQLARLALRPLSHGWHGNAVLYRNLQLGYTKRLVLPTLEPRGAVIAAFSAPKFVVAGAHLGLTRGMRQQQMHTLRSFIASCDLPVVVAGDFNEWRTGMNPFAPVATMIMPGPSFHAAWPRIHFDRFVISAGVSLQHAWVHDSALARKASDHLPAVIDIQLESAGL